MSKSQHDRFHNPRSNEVSDSFLNSIIKIAVDAHAGQVDKSGKPYILHPLAVMLDPELNTDEERAAAVGHDLLEDTSVTADDLRAAGIPEAVITAIEVVTKREGDGYEEFVERSKSDSIAFKVKRADIRHNSSPARLAALPDPEKRQKLTKKYTAAREQLGMEPIQD